MRWFCSGSFGLAVVVGLAFGCGESEGGKGSGAAGAQTTSGASAVTAGTSSQAGGTSSGGQSSSGGSSAGGHVGGSAAGTSAGSADGGEAAAGGANSAGAAGSSALVDCDPKKILCKRLAPECAANEVPSVAGSCYGDCVKIDRCGCTDAAQCPDPNQYTCWAKNHCGPFVQ
jgi:hypothetical protein